MADLYQEYKCLTKNCLWKSERNKFNQHNYSEKVKIIFDISNEQTNSKIKVDEDRQFLMLQKKGSIDPVGVVDRKLVEREQRSLKRRKREKQRASLATSSTAASVEFLSPSSLLANEESEYISDINVNCANKYKRLRKMVFAIISSTLDCTNTSVCKSAMIKTSILKSLILNQLNLIKKHNSSPASAESR